MRSIKYFIQNPCVMWWSVINSNKLAHIIHINVCVFLLLNSKYTLWELRHIYYKNTACILLWWKLKAITLQNGRSALKLLYYEYEWTSYSYSRRFGKVKCIPFSYMFTHSKFFICLCSCHLSNMLNEKENKEVSSY